MIEVGDKVRIKDSGPFCRGTLGEVIGFGFLDAIAVLLEGEHEADYLFPDEIELVGVQP